MAGEAALSAVYSPRDAAEVLIGAMTDADAILQRLKETITSGRVQPADLSALGEWIDRAARISKTMVDAKLDERKVVVAETQGALLAGAVRAILERLLLSEEQKRLVPVVVPEELRRLTA